MRRRNDLITIQDISDVLRKANLKILSGPASANEYVISRGSFNEEQLQGFFEKIGEVDYKAAFSLYSKAADQGDLDGTVALANMHHHGQGIPASRAIKEAVLPAWYVYRIKANFSEGLRITIYLGL